MIFATAALFATVFSSSVLGAHDGAARRDSHHHQLAERKLAEVNLTHAENVPFDKRSFSNQRATWYTLGEVACGGSRSGDEFVVALSQQVFGWAYPSPYCGRRIQISMGGKTAEATIVDSCVACPPPGGLDFSTSLFTHFGDIGLGVLSVDWHFIDGQGGDDGDSGNDQPKPSPSPKPKPKPTTHAPPPPPKTTSVKHTTTHKTTSTHKATTSHKPTTTAAVLRVKPSTQSAAPSPSATGNLYNLPRLVLNLDNLLQAASGQSSS